MRERLGALAVGVAAALYWLFTFSGAAYAQVPYQIGTGVTLKPGAQVSPVVCPDPTTGVVSACAGESAAPAPYQETYLGNQTAVTLAGSTALTPTATATIADIVVENNATYAGTIRCLADGTAPTATTGLELKPSASWRVVTAALSSVKCIQESSGTPGAIDVQYGK